MRNLVFTAVIAALLGGIAGFALGKQSTSSEALADSYVGTAGHTKTYASVANLIRKGQTAEALKLLDAMISAGVARLSDAPPNLDDEARSHIESSLAAVQEYRQPR